LFPKIHILNPFQKILFKRLFPKIPYIKNLSNHPSKNPYIFIQRLFPKIHIYSFKGCFQKSIYIHSKVVSKNPYIKLFQIILPKIHKIECFVLKIKDNTENIYNV
jgi:hypothetical protein